MSLQGVERVRAHLHECQRDHPPGPVNPGSPVNNVEMSTRYILVDPVWRSLEWDLSYPSQCVVEYATAGGSGRLPGVDYALIGRDGCPVILVEAKRLGLSGRMASTEDRSREREAVREYLRRPGAEDGEPPFSRGQALPGYSPDFNADEAIWGWAGVEGTGNLCLRSRAAVQERVGSFLARLTSQKDEVKRRCRTVPASKGRIPPARLPARSPTSGKCTSHLGFGLDLGCSDSRTYSPALARGRV